MQSSSPVFAPILWGLLGLAGVSLVLLTAGFTLLLGTTSHRNVALPLVWIGATVQVVAATVLTLLFNQG